MATIVNKVVRAGLVGKVKLGKDLKKHEVNLVEDPLQYGNNMYKGPDEEMWEMH